MHAPRSRVDLAIAREAISSCATRGLTEKFVKGSAAYGIRTVPLLLELGRSSGSRPPMITCQCAWWWLVAVRVDGVSVESASGLRPGRLSWGQNRL